VTRCDFFSPEAVGKEVQRRGNYNVEMVGEREGGV
jgi:hypothetical protein